MWKKPNQVKNNKLEVQAQSAKMDISESAEEILDTQITEESSIMGKSMHIKGDISGQENLLVQGKVEGTICLHDNILSIGKHGHLTANIYARMIYIEGQLNGDAYAREQIVIHKSAQVDGNIFAPRVTVEDGAIVKGKIDMDATSLAKHFPARSQKAVALDSKEKPNTFPLIKEAHSNDKKVSIKVLEATADGSAEL